MSLSLTDEQRTRTLERFERHRRAWDGNPALRTLYADWYGRIARELPPPELGPRLEIGSGPGFAREFIPDLQLTDIVRGRWHDHEVNAERLPFDDASLGALVLLDVLHHLPAPGRFFVEATRALRPGGRIVMFEPYMSPLSYPIYKLFHEEPIALVGVDPLAEHDGGSARDPFDSNQGIPTLMFGRGRQTFEAAFPELKVTCVEQLAGPSYPASGGFSRRPFLPLRLWSLLHALEARVPRVLLRPFAFRMLVVLDRR